MFMIFLKWSNLYAHSAYFVFQEAKVGTYIVNYLVITIQKDGLNNLISITLFKINIS